MLEKKLDEKYFFIMEKFYFENFFTTFFGKFWGFFNRFSMGFLLIQGGMVRVGEQFRFEIYDNKKQRWTSGGL